ncbi:MAG: NAD-dependent epimerase/dehydratase family protein [Thermoleophilia bacterium]|nr:NAD-dependent epimerase/dehydratase family protein [Thermoleophilia bacterium]
MKILLTGGAGFIASHAGDRLIQLGHEVAVVDNLVTGKRENVPEGARFFEIDVRNPQLDQVFGEVGPEVVVHQAAQMDVRRSVADPAYDAQVNILGTLNLLECSRRHNVRKVVYAGTGGAMFGEAKYLPADEAHPVLPLSPYGVSKHTVEHYLFTYRENFGTDFTVLRYPNVYGPRQDPHGEAGVVAIFSLQMLRGQRPTIFGDGGKTRDYCYVDDIVAANMLALDKGAGGLYNLGRGIEVSDYEIFAAVRDAVGMDVEPIYAPTRPGEVEHIALDASLARRELGWEWRVDLTEGVGRAVSFYKLQLSTET